MANLNDRDFSQQSPYTTDWPIESWDERPPREEDRPDYSPSVDLSRDTPLYPEDSRKPQRPERRYFHRNLGR